MISAPNHRLRLNGSKTAITCLVIFGFFSCAGPRKVVHKPPVTPTPTDKEDKIRVYDPKTDTYILIPRDAIKVDTVQWTEDKTPPIVTDENVPIDKPTKKEKYEIALLMPFNVSQSELFSDYQDPKLNRFIQYYAGIEMAMDEIDSMGLPVVVHSYDVDDPSTSIGELFRTSEIHKADVIIGPYEKEDIEIASAFGLSNEIMVVSPWLSAFSGTTENPFLIQLFPGLSTHAQAITSYIKEEMPGKNVFVVSRNNPAEINRMQLFTSSTDVNAKELIIKDSSPDLINTNLHTLLEDEKGTIFILPYYAKQDETFVNSFMRKLHADKDTREAIVFGLPQWIGYTNLNANYMESLALHLSISSFIDVSNPAYPSFRNKFFRRFHIVPDLQAFQGYDLMMWVADRLIRNGQEGLIGYMDPYQYGLASGFDVKPVFRIDPSSTSEMKVPLYYENRRIRILHYVEQDFILAR